MEEETLVHFFVSDATTHSTLTEAVELEMVFRRQCSPHATPPNSNSSNVYKPSYEGIIPYV